MAVAQLAILLLLALAQLAVAVVLAPAADTGLNRTLPLPTMKVLLAALALQVALLATTSPTNQMPSRTSLASMNSHAAQALVSQLGVTPK